MVVRIARIFMEQEEEEITITCYVNTIIAL